MEKEKLDEVLKRYGINIEKLRQEQIKLAETLDLKDSLDFQNAERIAAIDTIIIKNQVIAAAVICDKDFNILDQQYSLEKLRFPYIHGFRSYRELTAMVNAFSKLQEHADIVLVAGEGVIHPRLGTASHFALATNMPSIGISETLFEENKIEGEDILLNGKKVGKVFHGKEGSNPLYISPGNKITIKSAFELCRNMMKEPHKHPEPLHFAHKYAKSVKKELRL